MGTTSAGSNLSQLQFELDQAADRLSHLREQCAAAAVRVATAVHQNEEQRAKIPARVTLQTIHPTASTGTSTSAVDNHTIQYGLPMAATVTLRQRQQLERLQTAIQDEAMMTSIQEAQSQVRRLRWQWALQAFAMHRLDVEEPEPVVNTNANKKTAVATGKATTASATATTTSSSSSNNTNSRKQARGIGKIGGLPLPHAGPELYGVLPPNELQSALRLTSSVTASVARCLGIILPHPVLLQPRDSPVRDIVEMAVQHGQQQQSHAALHGNTTRDSNSMDNGNASLAQMQQQQEALPESTSASTAAFLSSSTASLASLMGQTAKKAIARATGQQLLEETVAQVAVPITMEPALVQQRLHHAVAAVLAEANTTSTTGNSTSTPLNNSAGASGSGTSTASITRYSLSATATASDEFAIALQLLQNNIVALCIRAGVPVTALWPAEAVLLNLHALQVYCREQLS